MSRWKAILGEPIIHFLLVGVILYVAAAAYRSHSDPRRIVVDQTLTARLSNQYRLQFGRPPSRDDLRQLTKQYVGDEALYREGIALGLADGDEIVRRRIIQKMEFLVDVEGEIPEPSDAVLIAYQNAHKERYSLPERISFSHLYFSIDAGGEAVAQQHAARALALLQRDSAEAGTIQSDPFPGPQNLSLVGTREIERIFGNSAMAAKLPALPQGLWSGPLRSGYGWHLVRVEARENPAQPSFAEVRDRIQTDWQDEQRERRRADAMAVLLKRFKIVPDA